MALFFAEDFLKVASPMGRAFGGAPYGLRCLPLRSERQTRAAMFSPPNGGLRAYAARVWRFRLCLNSPNVFLGLA